MNENQERAINELLDELIELARHAVSAHQMDEELVRCVLMMHSAQNNSNRQKESDQELESIKRHLTKKLEQRFEDDGHTREI